VDLVLADNRNIVLRLTREDASVAADAGVQVDRHRPGVGVRRVVRIESQLRRNRFLVGVDELRVAAKLLQSGRPDDLAPLHTLMELRAGERPPLAGLTQLETSA